MQTNDLGRFQERGRGRRARWAPALLISAALATPGSAGQFAQFVAFGDNLSDPGNVYYNTGREVPPPPYFNGRFSNGIIWIEHASAILEFPISTPTVIGGENYAFGGATTGEGRDGNEIPRIGRQIDRYFAYRTPLVGDLHVVWAGMNDLILGGPEDDPIDVVGRVSGHVTRLAAAGASSFFVPNLPPIGLFPEFLGTPREAELNAQVLAFNALLDLELLQLRQSLDVEIIEFDAHGLFSDAIAHPGDYGFKNVTAPAYDADSGSIVPDPDAYMFWDTINPTREFHRILGEAAAAAIPEPATLLLALLGFAAIRRR